MTAIPATVFANPDVRLRVWFNDGVTARNFSRPDQRIAAVGYAMVASTLQSGATMSSSTAAPAASIANSTDNPAALKLSARSEHGRWDKTERRMRSLHLTSSTSTTRTPMPRGYGSTRLA